MTRKISVLIVDDEENLRDLLKSILEREGCVTRTAASVAEAREALEEGGFEIVISDIKMPGETGYDLLRYIREEHPGVGVILITGHGDTYSVKDAMLLGADEYLTKPFKSHEMAVMVERLYWRLRSRKSTEGAGQVVE